MKKSKISVAFPALLLLAVMLFSGRLPDAIAVLTAVALHEAGHLLAARLLRISLRRFSFDLLGARIDTADALLSYRDEILLCAAGPFVNFLSLAVVLPWLSHTDGIALQFLTVFSAASAGLGLLNLLPVISFDGGRILSCLISLISDSERAERTVRVLSFFCIFGLWSGSVYLLLRTTGSISVFVFSISLFARFFIYE